MKEIKTDELKKIEFDLLKFVKEFCKENNLTYFLCGGTLLGAVRHKGFIPWDDDIDIFMPIKDYKKFIQLMKNNEKYRVLNPYDDEEYYYLFAKLVDKDTIMNELKLPEINDLGVNIDIFPIYGLPDDKDDALNFVKKLDDEYNVYKKYTSNILWNHSDNLIKKCIKTLVRYPNRLKYRDKINKKYFLDIMEKYNLDTAKNSGYTLSWYVEREINPTENFSEAVDIEFEGENFSAPCGYKDYLTKLYGDYMQLPPVEKRVSHHNFKAWWKHKN